MNRLLHSRTTNVHGFLSGTVMHPPGAEVPNTESKYKPRVGRVERELADLKERRDVVMHHKLWGMLLDDYRKLLSGERMK